MSITSASVYLTSHGSTTPSLPWSTQADASSKTITTLKTRTPDKTDELVLVLATTTDANGDDWYDVRLPIRPNGSTGWVKAADMSDLQPLDTWLKINTEKFEITLIKNGKSVFHTHVGVGLPQTYTPHGNFYIRDKLTGYGGKGSFYGPVAFATSATSRAPQRSRRGTRVLVCRAGVPMRALPKTSGLRLCAGDP